MAKHSVQKPSRARAYYSSIELIADWKAACSAFQPMLGRVCQAVGGGILKQREMNAWKRTGNPMLACAEWWNALPHGTRVTIDRGARSISQYPAKVAGSRVVLA